MPKRENFEGMTIIRELPGDTKTAMLDAFRSMQFVKGFKILTMLVAARFLSTHSLWHKRKIAARSYLEQFVREENIDAVISINCSVELSFPLLYLRQVGKLPCKWIWYMIDPFASHDYYKTYTPQGKLRALQRKIMQSCDHVIMTNEIYRETCEWENPHTLEKTTILKFPKIISLKDQKQDPSFPLPSGCINVLCTGTRDDEVRDSRYTLALCKQIPDVNFHFIGVNWAKMQVMQEENLFFYPRQKMEVIRRMQEQADFLLNIGNKNPNQIPSKVLEYINTGKPVVNVYKTESCPTLKLLQEYDTIHLSEKEPLENTQQLLNQYLHTEHSVLTEETIFQKYQEYTPKYFVDRFLQLL